MNSVSPILRNVSQIIAASGPNFLRPRVRSQYIILRIGIGMRQKIAMRKSSRKIPWAFMHFFYIESTLFIKKTKHFREPSLNTFVYDRLEPQATLQGEGNAKKAKTSENAKTLNFG